MDNRSATIELAIPVFQHPGIRSFARMFFCPLFFPFLGFRPFPGRRPPTARSSENQGMLSLQSFYNLLSPLPVWTLPESSGFFFFSSVMP
jgi:hypothetical protein